jgi:hypothetical protein
MIGLRGPQRESVVALAEFEGDAGNGGCGAMFDSERNVIVGVAAEAEVGIPPGVEFGRSALGLTGADGASPSALTRTDPLTLTKADPADARLLVSGWLDGMMCGTGSR